MTSRGDMRGGVQLAIWEYRVAPDIRSQVIGGEIRPIARMGNTLRSVPVDALHVKAVHN